MVIDHGLHVSFEQIRKFERAMRGERWRRTRKRRVPRGQKGQEWAKSGAKVLGLYRNAKLGEGE